MQTRNLSPSEWAQFFNKFSRQYAGQPVTIEVTLPHAVSRKVATQLPLLGIMADTEGESVKAIHIMVATPSGAEFVHNVDAPLDVRIGQISNGADEVLIIDAAEESTLVDFRESALHPDLHGIEGESRRGWPV